ncbi:MAG: hypothetical protein HC821_00850 [Lewinella sp.]|nr:hypothetical protein [Lewinella sp.]
MLFLVLDAPPHNDSATVAKMQALTLAAAAQGVRIIPLVCSGMDQSGEYLMRSLALATNGTYTFLTDHSGIGGKHLEPSTDAYTVEKLNDLLVRLVHQFGRVTDCGQPLTPQPFAPPLDSSEVKLSWKAFPNPTTGPLNVKLPKSKRRTLAP